VTINDATYRIFVVKNHGVLKNNFNTHGVLRHIST
jgi:hypothetical protein